MNVTALSEVQVKEEVQTVPPRLTSIWIGVRASDDPKDEPNAVTREPPRPGPVVGFRALGDGDVKFMSAASWAESDAADKAIPKVEP